MIQFVLHSYRQDVFNVFRVPRFTVGLKKKKGGGGGGGAGGGGGLNISGSWNSLRVGTFWEQENLNITQVLWHAVRVGQGRVYTNTSSILRLAWGWWWDWGVGGGDSRNTTTVLTPHSAIRQKQSLMAQGSTTVCLPAECILPAWKGKKRNDLTMTQVEAWACPLLVPDTMAFNLFSCTRRDLPTRKQQHSYKTWFTLEENGPTANPFTANMIHSRGEWTNR